MDSKKLLDEVKKLSYDEQVSFLYQYTKEISENEELGSGLNISVNNLKPTKDIKNPQFDYLKIFNKAAKTLTYPR